MPKTSYLTALHILDQRDGTSKCAEYIVELARKHKGNRKAMAAEAGVHDVTLWRYINMHQEALEELAVQDLVKDKE